MNLCICGTPIGNTGYSLCDHIFKAFAGMFMVQTYDSTGTLNVIITDPTNEDYVAIDDDYILARINDIDPSKRWYPINNLKNVTFPRAASKFQEFDDQSKYKTQKGLKTFKGIKPDVSASFFKAVEKAGCSKFSFFEFDIEGTLIGTSNGNGTLRPRKISKGSWDAIFMDGTDNTIQGVEFNFDLDMKESDGQLAGILSSEMDDIDLSSYDGLLDVAVVIVSASATEIVFKLVAASSSALGNILDEGLVTTELVSSSTGDPEKVRRTNNTPADVSVTALDEDEGTYTIAVASDVDDTIVVKPKRNGRNYTSAVATVTA